MSQHWRLVDRHLSNLRLIRRRADTAELKAAAVEERLQAVYSRCSSPCRQVGESLERLRDWVSRELRAVEVECAQFMGDHFGDLDMDLV